LHFHLFVFQRSRADISVDVTAELHCSSQKQGKRTRVFEAATGNTGLAFSFGEMVLSLLFNFFLLLNLLTFVEAEDFLACMHSKPKRLPVCFFLISRVA
jgi:hypothetical protein